MCLDRSDLPVHSIAASSSAHGVWADSGLLIETAQSLSGEWPEHQKKRPAVATRNPEPWCRDELPVHGLQIDQADSPPHRAGAWVQCPHPWPLRQWRRREYLEARCGVRLYILRTGKWRHGLYSSWLRTRKRLIFRPAEGHTELRCHPWSQTLWVSML